MQQSIGEQLQQTRQRLGLSIEDASNQLKIRKDILVKFENNEFNLKTPAIYTKGFFKAYLKFLKIYNSSLIADYDEIVGGQEPSENNFSLAHIKIDSNFRDSIEGGEGENGQDIEKNSAQYVKPILQFVHFKLLIIGASIGIILFILCMFVRYHKHHNNNAALPNDVPTHSEMVEKTDSVQSTFTIVAQDNVQVFIRQEIDKQRLFAGSLLKDERRSFAKNGPVQISYSEGNNLYIEQSNGTQIKPQKAGRGWIRLP